MNINDARSQRRDLERQIVDMILEYERDTGLDISGIFLHREYIYVYDDRPASGDISVKVDVEL